MFLVTGASGFLGMPVTRALLSFGLSVRALVRPGSSSRLPAGVDVFAGNLLDPESLKQSANGCDGILHLAGKAHDLGSPNEQEFRHVNVEGTAALLEAARHAGVRTFVFVSSVKAMGEGGKDSLDEETPPAPRGAYGISKLEAERLVLEEGLRSGMHASVLRLPLVYGPGLKGNLRAMLDAVARGTFPPPPRIANRRSLASVQDVASALLLAARSPAAAGRTYLVTDGKPYSTREIYDAMRSALSLPATAWAVPRWAFRAAALGGDAAARLIGRRMPFSSDALEKLLGSACYRNDRICRELGFVPATTLQAALPEIVRAMTSEP